LRDAVVASLTRNSPAAAAGRHRRHVTGRPPDEGVGTLVLGCTHYPLLREPIAAVMPGVALVDSAKATAEAVERLLTERALLSRHPEPRHEAFVTDLPASFHRVAERFLGKPLPHLEQVDVSV
jgi:glutamate racemase